MCSGIAPIEGGREEIRMERERERRYISRRIFAFSRDWSVAARISYIVVVVLRVTLCVHACAEEEEAGKCGMRRVGSSGNACTYYRTSPFLPFFVAVACIQPAKGTTAITIIIIIIVASADATMIITTGQEARPRRGNDIRVYMRRCTGTHAFPLKECRRWGKQRGEKCAQHYGEWTDGTQI